LRQSHTWPCSTRTSPQGRKGQPPSPEMSRAPRSSSAPSCPQSSHCSRGSFWQGEAQGGLSVPPDLPPSSAAPRSLSHPATPSPTASSACPTEPRTRQGPAGTRPGRETPIPPKAEGCKPSSPRDVLPGSLRAVLTRGSVTRARSPGSGTPSTDPQHTVHRQRHHWDPPAFPRVLGTNPQLQTC